MYDIFSEKAVSLISIILSSSPVLGSFNKKLHGSQVAR